MAASDNFADQGGGDYQDDREKLKTDPPAHEFLAHIAAVEAQQIEQPDDQNDQDQNGNDYGGVVENSGHKVERLSFRNGVE